MTTRDSDCGAPRGESAEAVAVQNAALPCSDCGRPMERHRRVNGNQRWDCECGLSRPYRGEDR